MCNNIHGYCTAQPCLPQHCQMGWYWLWQHQTPWSQWCTKSTCWHSSNPTTAGCAASLSDSFVSRRPIGLYKHCHWHSQKNSPELTKLEGGSRNHPFSTANITRTAFYSQCAYHWHDPSKTMSDVSPPSAGLHHIFFLTQHGSCDCPVHAVLQILMPSSRQETNPSSAGDMPVTFSE